MSDLQLQLTYAAVKRREIFPNYPGEDVVFDVWTWNVFKLKWTRMSQHGSGWTDFASAKEHAIVMNNITSHMLAANREPPPALGKKRAIRN